MLTVIRNDRAKARNLLVIDAIYNIADYVDYAHCADW